MKLSKCTIAITAGLALFASVPAATVAASPVEQPNVVLILTDDMGYSDLSCFGGEIPTPNICELAENGSKLVDYYTNPMSAPTRSMLMTGVDNHKAGLGNMPPLMSANQLGQPGYEGILNNRVATVAEMLKEGGYSTYMAGKWHLGATPQSSPLGRGFTHSFAFTGGGISHFGDQLPLNPFEAPFFFYMEDGKRVDTLPADFYSTDFYTDQVVKYIGDTATDKPFFTYLAYTAPHDPLHAPDEWIAKFDDGRYDVGYDVIRKRRLENVKKLGLVAEDTPDVVNNKDYKPWDMLSEKEQKRSAKKMAIYAAMIANLDHNIGRLVQHLKDIGEYENTRFIYTHDNGTNPKPGSNYTGNVPKFFEQFDNSLENMGRPNSYVSYEAGWAEAGTTPFSFYKTTSGQGGVRVPLIISGSDIAVKGEFVESGNIHVTDITPTILDWANIEKPKTRNGVKLHEFSGRTLVPFLTGKEKQVRSEDEYIAIELNDYKLVIKGDYKLRAMSAAHIRTEGRDWKLFNIANDPAEQTDIAEKEPEKLAELVALYNEYATEVGIVDKDLAYPTMYHRQTWTIREGRLTENPDKK
ncbi:arylsulfatase [Vibrio algarum]|uniref:Arylsulfatase n=1 Tax=Vibrio algarum TaxID=3020714 RepID=A0ABT4YUM3_9VIBR|nr:arylsulfatase [Vibrio sp. KJ40-1]MDB1125284.1 arylsulfatase [Vibrio sp. KJ40-1]